MWNVVRFTKNDTKHVHFPKVTLKINIAVVNMYHHIENESPRHGTGCVTGRISESLAQTVRHLFILLETTDTNNRHTLYVKHLKSYSLNRQTHTDTQPS